jgi:DNA-binding NarL/FixJ family response regulator
MTIRVLLADDQTLVRTGLRMILESAPDMEVVAEAHDGAEAVALTRRIPTDIVLMDVRMPTMDGVQATRHITTPPNSPRVLILTTFDLDEYVYAALKAGASGFLLKDAPAPDLLSAIRVVADGHAVVAPQTTHRLITRFITQLPENHTHLQTKLALLTDREREVLGLLARGLSNAEIATALFLSEGTIKTHVGHLLAKLDLRDRVQAVVFAYESGIARTNPTPPPTAANHP